MIKEGILRTYARALLRKDDEHDLKLIEDYLNDPAFVNLTTLFDQHIVKRMVDFKAKHAALAAPAVILPPAQTDTIDQDKANPIEQSPIAASDPLLDAEPSRAEAAQTVIAFRLPNARVGDAYSHVLAPARSQPEAVVYLDIAIPASLGLTADLASGTISGTPPVAGEFDIPIRFHFAGDAPPRPHNATVSLLVNQDPKLMWKDLPSDRADRYWKADEESSTIAGADFRIVAASKRGRSHAHVGSFRDDDYLIDHLPESGWYIAVVSDGAGSAKYSRRGSQIICREAAGHLKRSLQGTAGPAVAEAAAAYHDARSSKPMNPERVEAAHRQLHSSLFVTVGHAAHHAVKAIHAELASHPELNAAYRDFSSTAMIAACRRFPFGILCVAYWVGDGAVGVYSKANGITLLGDVDSGEFSGQTRFLDNGEVSAEALALRTRFVLVEDMTALVLMTDGVSDPKFDTEANLSRQAKWDDLWQDLDRSVGLGTMDEGMDQRLLAWLDFWSQGNHDDRSIALVLQEK